MDVRGYSFPKAGNLMDFLVDLFLHLDVHLKDMADSLGPWLYLILFVIIFCETGLVVTPFLPGDSLLFAVGALGAATGEPNLILLLPLLIVAAVAGDAVNYWAGYLIGPKVFQRENSWILNKKHLLRAQAFYEKHGGKTIVLARFVPIVRTFAPFVAGVGKMNYSRFIAFNVVGGVAWVAIFLFLGYLFGNIPFVKNNFEIVTLGIVLISILPMVFEYVRSRRQPQPAPVSDAPVQGEIYGAA